LNLRTSLEYLTSYLYSGLIAESTDFSYFKEVDSVLILRSGNLDSFRNLVENLKKQNPDLFLYVITTPIGIEGLKKICGERCEIFECESAPYTIDSMNEITTELKKRKINEFIILFNNRYGYDYQNIEDIILALTDKSFFAFNNMSELLVLTNPYVRKNNRQLLESLADWYWEHLNEKKEYGG
jgi:hypothetical protein